MKHETFVVQIEGTELFLTGYNNQNPQSSIFGNLENAIEYHTLEDAQNAAALIGGGTVGTSKP